MKASTKLFAAGLALGSVAAFLGVQPASATGNVTVDLSNVAPTRTVSITDLQGNDLTATGFTLGANTPSTPDFAAPFRVAVTDANMTLSTFNVQAEMTNLYQCSSSTGGTIGGCALPATAPTGNQMVASGNVSLTYPTDSVGIQSVSALVAPLFNITGTVPIASTACTDMAALNTTLATNCATTGVPVSLPDLAGVGQTLSQTTNLGSLSTLPMVPSSGEPSPPSGCSSFTHLQCFYNPLYHAGVVTYTGSGTASPLSVIQGSLGSNGIASTTLSGAAAVGGLASDTYINQTTIQNALRSALGVVNKGVTALGDQVWDVLPAADQQSIIADLAATPVAVSSLLSACPSATASCVVGLSGLYQSFPSLNVHIPSGTANGTYLGTMLFTGF